MFHLHVCGVEGNPWLSGYDGGEYSNEIMGKWFGLYKRYLKIYICYINHPIHPV